MIFRFIALVSVLCAPIASLRAAEKNPCEPAGAKAEAGTDKVTSEAGCRPFRTGFLKLAPELDMTKPLGMIDEAGWSVASNLLIGSIDPSWVVGYELSKKKVAWWLKTDTDLTAPIEILGSWALLALRDGRILKVETKTGKVVWEARLNRFVSSRMALSGTTLLAYTVDQKLFGLDFQSGQNLWVYDGGLPSALLLRSAAGPVVSGNDVYIGTSEGEVHAVALATGKELWRMDAGGEDARFRDVVGDIGIGQHQIYVTRNDGTVFALDTLSRPSEPLWKEKFPSITSSAYRDGTLYVGCLNGDLIALQAVSGRQLWKVNLGQSVKSLTIGESAIFVGGSQGRVTALSNASGGLLWHDDLRGILTRQPVVVDEQIYFATGLKVLYGYKIL